MESPVISQKMLVGEEIVTDVREELWSVWGSEAGCIAPVQPAHHNTLSEAGGMSA